MVFVGDMQAPTPTWPHPPMTVVSATPVVREKPFLFVDATGHYFVMRPDLKTGSSGASWSGGNAPGAALSIDRFYIAKPATDTAATMNAALAAGKHLLLTPGDYVLDAPIQVSLPDTIVLGIGFPVLTPKGGNALVTVADVDGVSLAGFLVEAGATTTATLMQLGTPGASVSHAADPTVLSDVHCRIGGNIAGTATSCLTIDSHDVILDNTWLWRADHGVGADWNTNMSDSGLIVNGDNVTAYGLFVEHHQKYQTVWNGNGGSVYFYQSELPYDPPTQSAWMATATENGYPSYKVAANVTSHRATGMGVYSFFQNTVYGANAIETPSGAGIVMSHMMTYSAFGGGISAIINGTGGSASGQATAYSAK
jgi:hypothetical protein